MTKVEYLKYGINKKYHYDFKWLIIILGILDNKQNNDYLVFKDNKCYIKETDEIILDYVNRSPMFSITDSISIDPSYIENVNSKIETTIGRLIVNLILLVKPFGKKIPYINSSTSIKKIESIIGPLMRNDTIKIEEYLEFTRCVQYLTSLSKITNVSATPKSMLPPPNIEELKNKTKIEFNNKYGENWVKDRTLIAKYQEVLKEADDEWLKDDPSNGKLIAGKIKNNTRVKMYLTFGGEVGFDKTSGKVQFIENSLTQQYPKDRDQLAAIYNSSRAGSFGRGHETQKGGAAAKDLLRSTTGMNIIEEDCGTKQGLSITVNDSNSKYLEGRYLLNGKRIDNPKDYLNQTITIRSALYCKCKGEKFCKKCCGDVLFSTPNGIGLKLLGVSAALLTISLKGMHDTQIKLVDYNLFNEMK